MNSDSFWLDNISVLYSNGNYKDIIPTNNMTRVEQLNALTRFFIILFVILIILDVGEQWVQIPIIFIILIIIFYNFFMDSDNNGSNEKPKLQTKDNNVKKTNKVEYFMNDFNWRPCDIHDCSDSIPTRADVFTENMK